MSFLLGGISSSVASFEAVFTQRLLLGPPAPTPLSQAEVGQSQYPAAISVGNVPPRCGFTRSSSRHPKRGGFSSKMLVAARRMPQEFRQRLDISHLRDETAFEIPLKHHADVECRPRRG